MAVEGTDSDNEQEQKGMRTLPETNTYLYQKRIEISKVWGDLGQYLMLVFDIIVTKPDNTWWYVWSPSIVRLAYWEGQVVELNLFGMTIMQIFGRWS